MLKAATLCLVVCGLVACDVNEEVVEYCAAKSPVRISISFEERLIRVVDETGSSQVVSRIFPCSDGAIDHCFSGYITMFDPRLAARPGDDDKIEFVSQGGDEKAIIRITGPTSQISYRSAFEGAWPAQFTARFFDEMKDDEFSLC